MPDQKRFPLPFRLLAICLIVFLAWVMRARAVELLPADYDEDDYLRAAQEYAAVFRSGQWSELGEYNYIPEHPPLAKILSGLAIAQDPEVALIPERPTTAQPDSNLPQPHLKHARGLNAILGTLTVLVTTLLNPLAGLMLATHTYTIKYVSQVMLEALPALTSLLSVVCYARSKQSRVPGKTYTWLALSAIFLGLTAASKYLYAVVGFAILVDWFLENRRNKTLTRFFGLALTWGMVSLGMFFLFYPYLWQDPLNRLKESVFDLAGYAGAASEVERANYPVWQPFIWLSTSVAWHPGVFWVSADGLITLLAAFGVRRLWREGRVYALWLGLALLTLLLWRTKWPQYILVLTVPLCLSAAAGIKSIYEKAWQGWKERAIRQKASNRPYNRKEALNSLPWLLPGLIALLFLALYPMIYQIAISLTDLNITSLRDGFNGGVWRAAWLGLTGQMKAVQFDPFAAVPSTVREVRYVGPMLLTSLLSQLGGVIFFDILWTVLSIILQAALGIGVALMLHQRGVKLSTLWQTIFVLPWAVPEFIGALIWLRVLEPTVGWYSVAVPAEARTAISFDNPNYALVALLISATWYGFPFFMMAASASLKYIPLQVYDAAAIDGANTWTTLRYITWPLLVPLLVPAIIIRSIFAFNQFYLFFVMPVEFPMITLTTISYVVFNYLNQYAASAVINLVNIVVLIGFLVLFNRWQRAAEGVKGE